MKHATADDTRTAVNDSFSPHSFSQRDAELFRMRCGKFESTPTAALESAFVPDGTNHDAEACLTAFQRLVFRMPLCNADSVADRTRKHVATPARGSAAKRLNMFCGGWCGPVGGASISASGTKSHRAN